MKCDEIKILLNPYVDKELAASDADRVKKHLEECPACTREVAELEQVKEMLRGLPALTAPTGLLEGVRCNLARPTDKKQETNIFWRYGWLAASLASVAAAVLVVFTVMIQSRKSEMQTPAPAGMPNYRYSEKAKANFKEPVMSKSGTLDAIQAQPMLFTQQINISARDVDNTVAQVYAVASTQTPDPRLKAEYQKKQAAQEDFLAKAPAEPVIQDENPTVANSVAPTRERKIQQQKQLGQVVKISIPLSQKAAFIKQLKGNIRDKMVLSEMQAIAPDIQQQGILKEGFLADAGKAMTESEGQAKEEQKPASKNEFDKMARGGGREFRGKQSETNKSQDGKPGVAKKDGESKDTGIVSTGSDKSAIESPKDKPAGQPKPSPKATASTTPPAPPPPPAAPAQSAPTKGKGDASPSQAAPLSPPPTPAAEQTLFEKNTGKQGDADDAKNVVSQSAQSQLSTALNPELWNVEGRPEAMVEFIIFIEPTEK